MFIPPQSEIKNPSNRSFGFVFAVFFLVVAILPLLDGNNVRLWAVGASLVFGVLALVLPKILTPLNRLWTMFGLFLHGIVSPVALAIMFYGVFTPIGFIMRLLGKDLLSLHFDCNATTYWIERTPPGLEAESFKNQF